MNKAAPQYGRLIIKACMLWALEMVVVCSDAQNPYNLVPNYSFEQLNISCNSFTTGGGGATYWNKICQGGLNNYSYTCLNACNTNGLGVPVNGFGRCFQYAHSGNGYVGFYNYAGGNDRDYLQTKLLDTLQANKCYYIEFFVSVVTLYSLESNNVGLLVGDTAIVSYFRAFTPAIPQILQFGNPIITDTGNWAKVAGIYIAHGGEQYITIGNFNDNAHTDTINLFNAISDRQSGYDLDDVSVIPLDSMQLKADAGRDTTIVKGDSIWIGSRLCGLQNVTWYDAGGNVIDTGAPGLWVKPTANTFYVVEQNVCGQYSRDTVNINVQLLPVVLLSFKVQGFKSFNGNTNTLVSWETATEMNVSHFNVQRSEDGVNFENVGIVKAKGAGIYSFTAPPPPEGGIEYFRLKIVDKNGSITYSDIRELTMDNGRLTISPNPAKDYVTINGTNIKQVIISDMSGRVLIRTTEKKINISSLNNGVYMVNIETMDGNRVVEKMVKLP